MGTFMDLNKMNPKFKDITAWEQAQLLMQPAFIRVLDNLRKQLENSLWKGTYTEIQDPYPSYLLCLTYLDRSVTVNIWELCFDATHVSNRDKIHLATLTNCLLRHKK